MRPYQVWEHDIRKDNVLIEELKTFLLPTRLSLFQVGQMSITCNYNIPNTTNISNRLLPVTDGSSNAIDIKAGTSTLSYDGNGNMTSDGSKNAVIIYNLLNLPRQVTITGSGKTVKYIYKGTETKLQMTAPGANTLYAGAFEYSSDGTC